MNIEHFLTNANPRWMQSEGASDIVISTRIRLARNIAGTRFPISFNEQEAQNVEEKLIKALLSIEENPYQFSFFQIKDMPLLQRQILVEKHLISPNLANRKKIGSFFLTKDESISILVNEEDHIRIQCLAHGMNLEEAFREARKIDRFLSKHITYAYQEQYGYLTSCPTNVGTGLRASVMLHLPALTLTKQMNTLIQMMTRLGMVVRGIYGEGSENLGNIYQISNQITLGKSELDILQELRDVVEQVIKKEQLARKKLLTSAPSILEDRLSRSLGTLKYAKILSSEEAASCLSNVRLGVNLGLLEPISQSRLNECMLLMQPGFIQQHVGTTLQPAERDMYRAKLLQDKLNQQDDTINNGEEGEDLYDV
ncbi:MAG: protein arginine kinase [Solibacillus sp.]|jgi:protein arginine kinase|uniref:protein arginine kinase n=1 Tax=unclassified Solibacillus TaxID=2637870 RepID=UPI0030F7729A